MLRIYIGYDKREHAAYEVAEETAKAFGCEVIPIYENRLRSWGLLTRPVDRRGNMFDINSSAPQSTDFAITRFFVPILAQSGWCLFTDCDVVFLRDPHELLKLCYQDKAVMVVKHNHAGGELTKMDGQQQTSYRRKNWSSVILWNCDHPANQRLNTQMLNQWRGAQLHGFDWLADSEVGELPQSWNWLVNVQPKPENAAIAHFTLGGPWIDGWIPAQHDEIWLEAASK